MIIRPLLPFSRYFHQMSSRLAKMGGKIVCLVIRNKHHQAFAAIAAIGTTDLWRNDFIEPGNQLSTCSLFLSFTNTLNRSFSCFGCRKSRDPLKIGLIYGIWFDAAKLSFFA
jgi:phosphatidylserine decarboxylase